VLLKLVNFILDDAELLACIVYAHIRVLVLWAIVLKKTGWQMSSKAWKK
jgi:hypothetical protein